MNEPKGRWKPLPSRDKIPCYKDGEPCKERHPGCQDHCERMKAARKENQDRKAVERKKRSLDSDVTAFQYSGYLAATKSKQPER